MAYGTIPVLAMVLAIQIPSDGAVCGLEPQPYTHNVHCSNTIQSGHCLNLCGEPQDILSLLAVSHAGLC